MRLLALLLLLLLPEWAAAHVEVVRDDLDAIYAASPVVVRGQVVALATPFGSQGPAEVTLLVEKVMKGEAPVALTFGALLEHGPRWAVGERGFFFLAPRVPSGNGTRRTAWAATALKAESPGIEGAADLEAWFARDPRAGDEAIVRALRSPSTPLRVHVANQLRSRLPAALSPRVLAAARAIARDPEVEPRLCGLAAAIVRDGGGSRDDLEGMERVATEECGAAVLAELPPEEEKRGISLPGLVAGGACALGLLVGSRRRIFGR